MKRLFSVLMFVLIFPVSCNASPLFSNRTGTVDSGIKNIPFGTNCSVQVTVNNYSGVSRVYGTIDTTNFVEIGNYSTAANNTGTKVITLPEGSAFAGIKVIQTYRFHGASRSGRLGTG